MSDDNPYSSPQVETEQVETELVVAERSLAVHWVAVSSFLFFLLGWFAMALTLEHHKTVVWLAYPDSYILMLMILLGMELVLTPSWLLSFLGVLLRKRWGRTLALIISYLSISLGLGELISYVVVWRMSASGAFLLFVLPLLMIFHGGFVLIILLQKKYKAEFS